MSPFRDVVVVSCPRCTKPLVGFDVATCGCGTWVSSFAAPAVLAKHEVRPNVLTKWWRKREPCPLCEEQMLLRGDEPGLFQGCDIHGFWIDADTVEHTGLARGIDHESIQRRRDDPTIVELHRETIDRLISRRAARRERLAETERALDDRITREVGVSPEEAERIRIRLSDDPERLRTRTPTAVGVEAAILEGLRETIGANAVHYLLSRIVALEDANAELERRLAAVEQRTGLRGNDSDRGR